MKFPGKNAPSVVMPEMLDSSLDSNIGLMTYNNQIYTYNSETNQIEEYIPANQAIPINTPIVMQSTVNASTPTTPIAQTTPSTTEATSVAVDVNQEQIAQTQNTPTTLQSENNKSSLAVSNKNLYLSLGLIAVVTTAFLLMKNKK